MNRLIVIFLVSLAAAVIGAGQVKPRPTPVKPSPKATPKPAETPAEPAVDPGMVAGKTYRNNMFGFEIAFPDSWVIPGDELVEMMKKQGYDLRVRVPAAPDPQAKANVRRFEKNVTLLLTAYRSMPGTPKNAVVRIAAEDISDNPKIKDAVDYFDLMRAQIGTMKLPPDFEYSLVDAEKLGSMQFAFLDTSSKEGKRRMYATVRGKYAIIFTLTYTLAEDLVAFRRILEDANFGLRTP